MPYPQMMMIPGSKLMVLSTETEFFNFQEDKHYQVTIKLNALQTGETLELKYYTKDVPINTNDPTVWRLEEPSVTYTGPITTRENHTFPFLGAHGIKITGTQTGGTARIIEFYVIKI